jgi:hypothetical protein
LNSGRPSGAHGSGGGAPPLRNASATSGIQRAARTISAQPLAQVHGEQFQRAGHVAEQPSGQSRRIAGFCLYRPMLLSSHAAQAIAGV